MKLFLLPPLALALSSCAGVSVGLGIGYEGFTANVTVTKLPDYRKPPVKPAPPATVEPEGKEPVPVDPADETQPET